MPIVRNNVASAAIDRQSITREALFGLPDDRLAECVVTAPSDEAPNGSKVGDALWIWSKDQVPTPLSKRSLNFTAIDHLPVLGMELRRCMLAHMLFPLERYADIAGLRKRCIYLTRVAKLLAEVGGVDCSFHSVSADQFQAAFDTATADLGDTRRVVGRYICELQDLGQRKVIPGYLSQVDREFIVNLSLNTFDGLPERPEFHQEGDFGQWQPLPDDYVAEAGRRWVFYLEVILPQLVSVIEQIPALEGEIAERGTGRAENTIAMYRKQVWNKFLGDIGWHDELGRDLTEMPFQTKAVFPPENFSQLIELLSVCQGALIQVLMLMTGGRVSEVETLRQDCLVPAEEGEAAIPALKGRTFKLSGLTAGDATSWPIPHRVAAAVELQQKIAAVLLSDGSNSLWVSNNRQYWLQGKIHAYHHLEVFARDHGLEPLLGGTKVHPHRFRKSVARLAVLSLTGAPLILRDIFGHADIEGTLKYILSNPSIREEMRELALDTMMDQAETVAHDLDDAGGQGADNLRKIRDGFFDKLKVPKNERAQRHRMDEFVAAQLADGAVDLKMIFPGIVCLKPKSATGLCSKDEINTAVCRPNCHNFVALPNFKEHAERTIGYLLDELDRPEIRKNPLMGVWYKAQLKDHVDLFGDLKERFAADKRLAAALGEG
ncbi:tyrosine-type recombinase/integrase [Magnetospirillum sp. 64-120]|uniref:tyrosine-type recombinase/integrase n=1 Tax=Magnetospirillum sp. 64-120 TaxID=1895778 RepID=UPI000925A3E5|nr:tyrosine-type recombinase/integrase [Magnetospirillum sp. 64-120]OJX77439.1 MAG: hypothetical protein BGO92_10440 [Magnetospirillum sp. 64-120]